MTKKEFKERAQILTAKHAMLQFDKRLQVAPPTSFRECSFENDRNFYRQLGELAYFYLKGSIR